MDDRDSDSLVAANRLRSALSDSRGRLSVTSALTLAGFDRPSFLRSRIVSSTMRELGWDRGRYRFDGSLLYGYARGTSLEREVILDVERTSDGSVVVKKREF
jgi:hypothetical protein